MPVKPVRFMGTAKEDLAAFPVKAKTRAGHELFMIQAGREPNDWKAMPIVGSGACEIRVREESGAFRVIYVAAFRHAVYVLHAFRKKTRTTPRSDLDLAIRRYREAKEVDEESRP